MARVEIKGLAVGVVQDRNGNVRSGIVFTCSSTVYAASSGGSTLTGAALVSNSYGELPGWLESGVYTITIPAVSKSVTFEVGDDGIINGETRLASVESSRFVTVTDPAYGASPAATAAANTAAIAAALTQLRTRTGKGTLFFPRGRYDVDCTAAAAIAIGANEPITVLGEGVGVINAGTTGNTVIRRTAGTNPIFSVTGTSNVARGYGNAVGIEFDGGALAGTVVRLYRVSEVFFDRVRIKGAAGGQKGLHGTQVWNSTFRDLYVTACGSGTTHPAVLLDALAGEALGACDTVHFTACEFEGNTGTDIRCDGSAGDATPCNAITFTGCKLERQVAGASYPALDCAYAIDVSWNGGRLSVGGASTTSRLVDIPATGYAGGRIKIATARLYHTGTPDYLIDWQVGNLGLTNLSFESGASPPTNWVRCGSAAGLLSYAALDFGAYPSRHFSDARASYASAPAGRKVLLLAMEDSDSGVTRVQLGLMRVWEMPAGLDKSLYCTVRFPNDMRPTAPLIVTVLYSSPATSGTVKFQIQNARLGSAVNAATATSENTQVAVDTVAATANGAKNPQLTLTNVTVAASTYLPGGQLTLIVTHLGTQDTGAALAQPVHVHGVSCLYDVEK